MTVGLDRAGRWHVSILFETSVAPTPVAKATAVAIDLGIHSLATLSTGEKVTNPQFYKRDRRRIAKAHSTLNRKVKGSANHERARKRLARAHAKVADRRRDHLHKLSTRLIRENQTIVLEDLAVENLKRNGGKAKTGINRSISDAAWGQLRSLLEYKAGWQDRNLIIVDRFFPSSQLCSSCGARSGPTTLTVRQWSCDCGAFNDRDVNAARNILAAGLAATVCGGDRSRIRTPL
ncbi:IS605 OrfB family transposase [Brevibacterium marinum]|uniref:IS605 OrfB family transposase n=1 Tax=Brevibacterium marinum TaxID=418643 RepID=A0A846RXF5_9MICO|nr:IS605 OrfB family transposase [Brevibacterium marinum]